MVSFEPLEIIAFCIVIAAMIITSPHWLILWEKHKKEKRIKESPLCQPRVPYVHQPQLSNELPPIVPSVAPTPNLPKFPTSYNN